MADDGSKQSTALWPMPAFHFKVTIGAVLTELSLNYTLFNGEGAPLRAKAEVSFTNYVDQKTIDAQEANESPDITHELQVLAGDTLPLMTYRVYGDTRYYLKVARFNGLTDFRHLQPGTTLTFPPLS